MKKLLLLASFMMGTLAGYADEYAYPYLVFETTDGTTTSVPVESISISVTGGKLSAGGQEFTLTQLSKMYFSATATAITDVTASDLSSEEVNVYTISGVSLGKFQNVNAAKKALNKGIYVVKSTSNTYKIAVK